MPETQTLMRGLVVGESPRWHEGRLWFSNWGAGEIIAVDTEGNGEVMARVPTTIPFCFDWLPDGRMLVVSGPEARLLRMEPDASFVTHAGLGNLAVAFNEIVVDGRGNAYVNGGDFDFETGEVLQKIETDLYCFACMLGGEEGKTLFIVAARWRGVENMAAMFESHTGQVLTANAPAPRVGWP